MKRISAYLIFVIFTLSSCQTIFNISPYESYLKSLEQTGIAKSTMGKKWISSGQNALLTPNESVKYPFKSEIFFREIAPMAVSYSLKYEENAKITFKISSKGKENNGVYVDLVENVPNKTRLKNFYVKDTVFTFEDNSGKDLILRIQSQFLAVEDGIISQVGTNNLGGKVVWQRLGLFGQSIYYAHLDSQVVNSGQTVKKGDVLGFMGNTGNAKFTAPHLHFGTGY
jgi:peptidoglycan LD-endopeptidase LytH